MSGTVGKALGFSKSSPAPVQAAAMQLASQAPAQAAAPTAAATTLREAAEDTAAKRRARRGGRALLSEARINAEQGIQTLGSGNQL